MLSRRDLTNRYASSYAGVAWSIGVPLLYALVNVVVFSILMTGRMGSRYADVPFALFYFVPFSLWTLFSEVSMRSTGILREYSYLINKIAIPVWILPLIPLASALLSQLIIMAIVAGLMLTKHIVPAETAWVFIVIWALGLLATVGASYLLSAISLYIPDMAQIVPVLVNILFWLTPILYPAAIVEASGQAWVTNILMHFNPFYYLVESSRLAVFGSAEFPWRYVGIFGFVASVLFLGGVLVFNRLKPGFADVI